MTPELWAVEQVPTCVPNCATLVRNMRWGSCTNIGLNWVQIWVMFWWPTKTCAEHVSAERERLWRRGQGPGLSRRLCHSAGTGPELSRRLRRLSDREAEARRRHPESGPLAGPQSSDVCDARMPTRCVCRCLSLLGGVLPRNHPRADLREAGKRSLPSQVCSAFV